MTLGTLTLDRFNGREVYLVTSALLYLFPEEDHISVTLEVETGETVEKTTPEDWVQEPSAEVTIEISSFDPTTFVGSRHTVPIGLGKHDFLARLYYCEHQPIDENEIFVEWQEGDAFRIKWSGVTCDVNLYDGSKPPTRVLIDALFSVKS